MDLLDTLLYTLARIGLMIMLILLGAFVGEILFPGVATFLPYSMIEFKTFITDDTVQSVIAMLIVMVFFLWVFYDDGKRHSAYENWNIVNIFIVLILMLIVYFVPAIFRESFHSEGKAEVFYMIWYYPCSWLSSKQDLGYMTGVLVSEIIMIASAFAAYFAAYKIYVKKHPLLLVPKEERHFARTANDEENEESENDGDVSADYDG